MFRKYRHIYNAGLVLLGALTIALPIAFLLGAGMVITGIGIQSTLQMAIPEAYRGRVLSLYGICFMGGPALGALAIGSFAEIYGFQMPVVAAALAVLVLWAVVWPKRAAIETSLKRLRSIPSKAL